MDEKKIEFTYKETTAYTVIFLLFFILMVILRALDNLLIYTFIVLFLVITGIIDNKYSIKKGSAVFSDLKVKITLDEEQEILLYNDIKKVRQGYYRHGHKIIIHLKSGRKKIMMMAYNDDSLIEFYKELKKIVENN